MDTECHRTVRLFCKLAYFTKKHLIFIHSFNSQSFTKLLLFHPADQSRQLLICKPMQKNKINK
uniref:Uncharacterized protein n=1 Tax=Anguilla anguilla TaxID=7936 RepID=A0A0E9PCL4_ANGAN